VHKAVNLAEDAYAQREPDAEPRWTSGLDAAELAGVIGARYRDLSRHDAAQAPGQRATSARRSYCVTRAGSATEYWT
jgi:hypothetical protein